MGHIAEGPLARQLGEEGLQVAHLPVAARTLRAPGCGELLGEALRDTRQERGVPARDRLEVMFLAPEVGVVPRGLRR